MQITWFGQSCFLIRGEKVALFFDPFQASEVGIKLPKTETDAVLLTHKHFNHVNAAVAITARERAQAPAISGGVFTVDGPGEYEIGGAMIYGIPAFHDNQEGRERGRVTIYVVKMEGMTVCHLGALGQKELNENQIEKIGDVDVLFIPVGGIDAIGAREARLIVNQIEPRVVIPMRYALPGLKFKLEKVDDFLKEVGGATRTVEGKFIVKKKDLPQEGMEVVVMQI